MRALRYANRFKQEEHNRHTRPNSCEMRADKDHDDTIFLCVSPSGSAGVSTSLAETVSSGFPPFLTPLRKDGDLAAVSGVVETGDGTGCASTVGGLAGESSICTRASCRTRACCRPSPIRLVDAGGAGKSVACHGRVVWLLGIHFRTHHWKRTCMVVVIPTMRTAARRLGLLLSLR